MAKKNLKSNKTKTKEKKDNNNVTNLNDKNESKDNMTKELEQKIAELEKENAELKDRLLRALAETDNVRKRAEKEKEDTAKYAITKFAREILGVADNLRRALDSITEEDRKNNEQLQNIYAGVEATEKELLRAFDATGIVKLEPMDKPFDANFHEVMFEAEMPDKEAGHVIEVLEDGYMLNDRLLRPARVGVAKK